MKKALSRPQWNVSSWFTASMKYTLKGYSPNGKGMVL